MMPIVLAAVIGLCGAAGAVTRYLVDAAIRRLASSDLPIATTVVNVTGSFLLGVVTAHVLAEGSNVVRETVGIGFCGGYTTFSTAMSEGVRLHAGGAAVQAATYLLGLPVLCVLAAMLGFATE